MRITALVFLVAASAHAQSAAYSPAASQNAPATAYDATLDERGHATLKRVEGPVRHDAQGNAQGNQYDLAVDGAFAGQTVLILDQVGNTLENTKAALAQKGLNVVAYRNGTTPTPKELEDALAKSCELWLIGGDHPLLKDEHIAIIKRFFDAGHGVYVWGDNDPYYVDANRVAGALVPGLRMEGDHAGDRIVDVASTKAHVGVRAGHLITTGIEHLYEGVTIATIQFKAHQGKNAALYTGGPDNADRAPAMPDGFAPIMYGSAGNLVTVAYDKDGKRLVMDGGFTRLAVSWDDAGTARFVKNAAAWLVNSEKFHDTIAKR